MGIHTIPFCDDVIANPCLNINVVLAHDDVIKGKHFPRNWSFVREIHRSPVNFHTKASDSEH